MVSLDEYQLSLAPLIIKEIEKQVLRLKALGISILLAEQNIESALKISDRGYIIDNGSIHYEGSIGELRQDEEVRKKYLLV